MAKVKSAKTIAKEQALAWAVPRSLKIPPDPLQMRIDFHTQAVVIYSFEGDTTQRRVVSAMDIVHALSSELTFASGLLPKNCLWWANSAAGGAYALYEEPQIRKLAIRFNANEAPKRYTIPLPGVVFLCRPGQAPYVWAAKKRPTKPSDQLFHAPFLNMSRNGSSCGGTNKYPTEVAKIPEAFWLSFFTSHGDLEKRSKKFPQNIIRLWEELDGQKTYPLDDLVPAATVEEIMNAKERY